MAELNDCRVVAIYVPTIYHLPELSAAHQSTPLIVDIDAGVSGMMQWLTWFAQTGRRVTTRTFKLYFDTTAMRVQFQVPYIHRPMDIVPEHRDIVFVDIHEWEGLSWRLYCLQDLIKTQELDDNLVYYYNWPGLVEIYRKIVQTSDVDDKYRFIKHVIPYLHEFHDFRRIFSRLKLFASNHRWLTDLDTFNAYITGAPLIDWARSGYIHPMTQATLYLEPRLQEELTSLRPYDWSKIPPPRNNIPVELYKQAYDKLWDIIWSWARNGIVDRTLMELTMRSS